VGDTGGEGTAWQTGGRHDYGAPGLSPPTRHRRRPWPKRRRRGRAGGRPRVETADEKLYPTCRLDRARPQARGGLQARLAAKSTLHTVCIGLKEPLCRPRLACADLVAWES
jgi:hypothetical protein